MSDRVVTRDVTEAAQALLGPEIVASAHVTYEYKHEFPAEEGGESAQSDGIDIPTGGSLTVRLKNGRTACVQISEWGWVQAGEKEEGKDGRQDSNSE